VRDAVLEKGLLDAITENPDDEARRLVYADWLEDHGEPDRAALLRLACEREKLTDADPHAWSIDERSAQLLEANRERWQSDWPAAARTLVEFRRGLPSRLNITPKQFLRQGRGLRQRFPITALTLNKAKGQLPAVVDSGLLAGLSELRVDAGFSEDDVKALAGCADLSRLRRLDLSRCYLTTTALRAILTSPHLNGLTELDVDSCDGRDLAGLFAVAPLPALRKLSLASSKVTAAAVVSLAHSRLAEGLEMLDLSDNAVGADGAAALAGSPGRNLRTLRMSGCVLTDEGIARLAESPRLARVEDLALDSNDASVEGARALASSPHLSALRSLDLGFNDLGDEGLALLASSPHLRTLTTLDVAHAEVGDQGLIALANSAVLPHLCKLRLDHSSLTAAGLQALARSPGASELVELSLPKCRVDSAAAQALGSSPYLGKLRVLDLSRNRLGPAGAEALARSTSLAGLRRLHIYDNDLEDDAALALTQATWRAGIELLQVGYSQFSPEVRAGLYQAFGRRVI
jgi:uncharacterized protein (TIGR02996 family)